MLGSFGHVNWRSIGCCFHTLFCPQNTYQKRIPFFRTKTYKKIFVDTDVLITRHTAQHQMNVLADDNFPTKMLAIKKRTKHDKALANLCKIVYCEQPSLKSLYPQHLSEEKRKFMVLHSIIYKDADKLIKAFEFLRF